MKKLLLLLMLVGLPKCMFAEGEFPNVLVVYLIDGKEKAFSLDGATLSILPNAGKIIVASSDKENSYVLSEVSRIKYEYRDLSMLGISGLILPDNISNSIYGLDGRKLSSKGQTFQETLRHLPHGVYVVKVNGKTLKIAK